MFAITAHSSSKTYLSKCSNCIKPYVSIFKIFKFLFFAFLFIVNLLVHEIINEVQWKKLKNSSHFGLGFNIAYFFYVFWKKRNLQNADECCEVGTLDSSWWKYLKIGIYFKAIEIKTWMDKSKFWSCSLDNKWFCKQIELDYHRSKSS